MVKLEDVSGSLLQNPLGDGGEDGAILERRSSSYKSLRSFVLEKEKQYQQQYGDMYFLRLTKIKPAVEEIASAAFGDLVIGGESAKQVARVLDVRQGELCWVTGTVYMDMPLKPSILEDVAKDRWISAPSSVQKYYSEDGRDSILLEDDSGRVRLVGDMLNSVVLVTGCIIAVMGTENASGDFEVIDLKFPDLPPQPGRWSLSKPVDGDVEMGNVASPGHGGKIAIVSGLNFSTADTSYAMELNLLMEYLLGDAFDPVSQQDISRISRLIIAGNSISPDSGKAGADEDTTGTKLQKKYGYDASSYNAIPSQLLDEFLSELLPTIPVTFLPGEHDPANASFPQQPIHPAMFTKSRTYSTIPGPVAEPGWFDTVTNPWEGEVEGWRFLGTSGQNVDDVFKYLDSDDRLGMMEAMCRWRCSAPTAPDTLWSYPFQDDDPFVMSHCPHLYFVGNQPEFGTKTITGPAGQEVRLVALPAFSASKEFVLVDTETLEVTRVKISAT